MQLLGRTKFWTEDENPKEKVKFPNWGANFLKGVEIPSGGRNWGGGGGRKSWDTGTMWRQGGQIFLKGHFWIDIFKEMFAKHIASGVELRLIMFSIYWMIGVWGGSPPGDCAILPVEARRLHFLRFLKQIRKIIAIRYNSLIALTISENSLFRQGNPLNWKGTFAPLSPPGKGQWGRLPLLPHPSSGVPGRQKRGGRLGPQ
jgi:hypothetical protein